ncbi:GTP-binding protein Rho1, partial [Borealophlyctis nickersoniae]
MFMKRKKIVCVGDEAVGKTALLLVYSRAPFPDTHFPTVSETYIPPNDPTLELWDTAGSEELDRLRPFSYDQADVYIVCFDVGEPRSLLNVEDKWVPEVRYFSSTAPIILVGCKKDVRDDPEAVESLKRAGVEPVTFDQGSEVASRIHALAYHECSARTGEGVTAIFSPTSASSPSTNPTKPTPTRHDSSSSYDDYSSQDDGLSEGRDPASPRSTLSRAGTGLEDITEEDEEGG